MAAFLGGCVGEAADAPQVSTRKQAASQTAAAKGPCIVTPMASSKPGKKNGSCNKGTKVPPGPTPAQEQRQAEWLAKKASVEAALSHLSAYERQQRYADAKDAHFAGKKVAP